jgi:tetratricopeptide (TPR) repeat protein
MRTSERHHLKDNELAIALGHANAWATEHKRQLTIASTAIVLIAGALLAFVGWRNSVDGKARALLTEAMVVQEARVVPPTLPVDFSLPANNATPAAPATPPAATQPPGTYPTERAKLETALPKFLAAADAYPSTDAGRTARYEAASTLVSLGRFDEAIAQYDRVIADAPGLLAQMARLGKAEAQVRGGKFDAGIASFKELSERSDLGLPKEAMLLELARAYKLAGKNEDARKTLTQIVEQHASSPFVAEAKQELEKIAG